MLVECSGVYFKKPLRKVMNMRRLRGQRLSELCCLLCFKRVLLAFWAHYKVIYIQGEKKNGGDSNSRICDV